MIVNRRRFVNRAAILLVAIVVVVAVAVGILLLDSPAQERLRRLDERRISDLRELAYAIDAHWTRLGTLPSSLEELSSDLRFLDEIADPETGEPYEYQVLGENTYELCAMFSTDTAAGNRGVLPRSLWFHGSGRVCFEFDVRNADRPIERY